MEPLRTVRRRSRRDLGWYSGDDILNLPLLSVGANGFISVVGHLVADRIRAMAEAFREGRLGVMDYYRMRNVQSDTAMRDAIAAADDLPQRDGTPRTGA